MSKGVIYILTNPSFPDYIKIAEPQRNDPLCFSGLCCL